MPEYTAPGVYVEETSFRTKPIEGVVTTVAGFAGPARFGPVHLAASRLSSLADFERLYGNGSPLDWVNSQRTNFLWHAARTYFSEGGKELHIARVFRPLAGPAGDPAGASYNPPPPSLTLDTARTTAGLYQQDGHARLLLGSAGRALLLRSRFPGRAGNLQLRFLLHFRDSALTGTPGHNSVSGLKAGSLVWLGNRITNSPGRMLLAMPSPDGGNWYFSGTGQADDIQAWLNPPTIGAATAPVLNARLHSLRALDLSLEIGGADGGPLAWTGLSLQTGAANGLLECFTPGPGSLLPLELLPSPEACSPAALLDLLFNCDARSLALPAAGNLDSSFILTGGNDGQEPSAEDYRGQHTDSLVSGLCALGEIADISLVAAPGSGVSGTTDSPTPRAVAQLLIQHAEALRYRVAILDSLPGQSIGDVRAYRASLNSSRAALYYPWIQVKDPSGGQPLLLPPSGFIAGLIVRNDLERSVVKAPANLSLSLATGLETPLNQGQQDLLNPEDINCIRFFPGRGYLLWGARVLSQDPEWKYLNLRRYFIFLEHSIDHGTQWAVFEPNSETLWTNLRGAVQDFLLKEWQRGNLLGDKPDKAYFVKCDRSTMTQADLDAGRLICLIGVAPLKPAEFVLFRIGQWTADAKD